MKVLYSFLCALGLVAIIQPAMAQGSWPKTVATNGATVKIYEWQPESFSDNTLKARAAISVTESGKSDPVFGMAWITATTETFGNQVMVKSANINSIKLPEDIKDDQLEEISNTIEQQIKFLGINFQQDQLQQSLQLNTQQKQLSSQISNKPPKLIYSNAPSVLVLIDGKPEFKRNDSWGVDAVVNTPFTIVKNNGNIYLYGGKHWYMAPTVNGPYNITNSISPNLRKIEEAMKNADKDSDNNEAMEQDENTIYKIIVSTEPAELVQSRGDANFSPVEGTNLLYVTNSDDDIFMDISGQNYYVLISGRWFKSSSLNGTWNYVPADNLPADFAQIREGSTKDNVLASVAGTDAAQDALQEAQVPQTAKVERQKARAQIEYDGTPEFESIDGTDLMYATNTGASVLKYRGRYYSVDNGVWFEAAYPTGPWVVATSRPVSVALIPPSYPVYNLKYVYIYDVSPDYVYMGYTPGYLNAFIYGPTIVYGTGYYYRPWHRHYYYPRPSTWGYRVRYNPWVGWGFGFNFNAGWFNVGVGFGNYSPWNYWSGGWWGPRYYRAPYCYRPYSYRHYGYYSNRYYDSRRTYITHANHYNNIYNYRRDVVSRDNRRYTPVYRDNNYRRDYTSNPGRYNNNNGMNRPDRGRDYNRGNDPRFNNNNGRGNIDRRFDRTNRTDWPTTRNRDWNSRPDRTWTNPNNNNNNRGEDRPGRINNPRETPPGNNNGNNNGRPERIYNPRSERRDESTPGRNYERPRTVTPPSGNREPVRREYERPVQPQRDYNRGGNDRPNRSYSPPQRESGRQFSPPERRSEHREGGGGGGGRSGGGGERSRPSRA
ncbi:hypothetical protein HHL16_03580 [Pseudoflavitalea sp. G-6-1-2]|uniref:hypothetical protein n=1 Tax=Pseudoflavitalea sp. G-6-1-2 TaxID=2728841 RepID=UPI00146AD84A|nr:hypothetical protein [Pseudoflavitalea sp. G-6-1-2]NML19937.1 hypothetical protein [Pseudoflavitalea sp. G-6-1-2]